MSAQEGAEDNLDQARIDLAARGVRAGDMVVGIAASGTTPYVRVALEYAREAGARTVMVACSPPSSETLRHADIAIVAITGPEVVTGSTRLKAGTATKLILNMITTGAMVRLGKTFGNLMIDLRATNVKLVDRSERIVAEVSGVPREEARDLLARAGGSVKLAIVMHALGVDKDEAQRRLDDGGGAVRRVIGGDPPPVE
jgi:N-acetylmuramic acid 6-phosphate etherase